MSDNLIMINMNNMMAEKIRPYRIIGIRHGRGNQSLVQTYNLVKIVNNSK